MIVRASFFHETPAVAALALIPKSPSITASALRAQFGFSYPAATEGPQIYASGRADSTKANIAAWGLLSSTPTMTIQTIDFAAGFPEASGGASVTNLLGLPSLGQKSLISFGAFGICTRSVTQPQTDLYTIRPFRLRALRNQLPGGFPASMTQHDMMDVDGSRSQLWDVLRPIRRSPPKFASTGGGAHSLELASQGLGYTRNAVDHSSSELSAVNLGQDVYGLSFGGRILNTTGLSVEYYVEMELADKLAANSLVEVWALAAVVGKKTTGDTILLDAGDSAVGVSVGVANPAVGTGAKDFEWSGGLVTVTSKGILLSIADY